MDRNTGFNEDFPIKKSKVYVKLDLRRQPTEKRVRELMNIEMGYFEQKVHERPPLSEQASIKGGRQDMPTETTDSWIREVAKRQAQEELGRLKSSYGGRASTFATGMVRANVGLSGNGSCAKARVLDRPYRAGFDVLLQTLTLIEKPTK
jgi:hypothetical protein